MLPSGSFDCVIPPIILSKTNLSNLAGGTLVIAVRGAQADLNAADALLHGLPFAARMATTRGLRLLLRLRLLIRPPGRGNKPMLL